MMSKNDTPRITYTDLFRNSEGSTGVLEKVKQLVGEQAGVRRGTGCCCFCDKLCNTISLSNPCMSKVFFKIVKKTIFRTHFIWP